VQDMEVFKVFKLNMLLFFFPFFLSPSYCKKPLTSNCTIQIATPGNDGDSTPKPVPILAAALCTDKQSLLLVYGNTLQPIIEKVVRKPYWKGFGFHTSLELHREIELTLSPFSGTIALELFRKGICIPLIHLKCNLALLLAVSCCLSC